MITEFDLIKGLRSLGLKDGDCILVHSSYKSLGGVEGGPQSVINALLTILGSQGTLVIPTFNFTFCELFNKTGKGFFDTDKTPSNMGIITEIFRKMPDVKRSAHPFYSVAVKGKLRDELVRIDDKTAFGPNSIFGKLYKINAKILIIGLSYNDSWTFSHFIEQSIGVDYRYHKEFSGTIVENGKEHEDTFSMYVRDIDRGVLTSVDRMGEILEKKKVVKSTKIGDSSVRIMECKAAFDATVEEIKKTPYIMIEFEKK